MSWFKKKTPNIDMILDTIDQNHSGILEPDHSYWGDVAISFKNGDHLLLPITSIQMNHLNAQMQSFHPDKILHLISLDNRALFFNYSQVADIYVTHDHHDQMGPEDETPDYIAPRDLTNVWEALSTHFFDEQKPEWLSPEQIETIKDIAESNDDTLFINRLIDINWRLVSGKTRTASAFNHQALFFLFMSLLNPDDQDPYALKIENPDGPRQIYIMLSAMNYIWIPWHVIVRHIHEAIHAKEAML